MSNEGIINLDADNFSIKLKNLEIFKELLSYMVKTKAYYNLQLIFRMNRIDLVRMSDDRINLISYSAFYNNIEEYKASDGTIISVDLKEFYNILKTLKNGSIALSKTEDYLIVSTSNGQNYKLSLIKGDTGILPIPSINKDVSLLIDANKFYNMLKSIKKAKNGEIWQTVSFSTHIQQKELELEARNEKQKINTKAEVELSVINTSEGTITEKYSLSYLLKLAPLVKKAKLVYIEYGKEKPLGIELIYETKEIIDFYLAPMPEINNDEEFAGYDKKANEFTIILKPRNEKEAGILDSIYSKYQTALKMFYNYAKEKELYKLIRRDAIEKETLKILQDVEKETGLFAPSVLRAGRDVVTDIIEWMRPCKKVKQKKIIFFEEKCNFDNYPKLKESPAILYYLNGYSFDNEAEPEKARFVRIKRILIPVEIDESQMEILRKALAKLRNKRIFGIAKLEKKDGKWLLHVQINN